MLDDVRAGECRCTKYGGRLTRYDRKLDRTLTGHETDGKGYNFRVPDTKLRTDP